MKRQSGFTLIELVVVIVILGILAATAAPKFMNLQGDARISALNGLKGAVKSAVSMTYSKAILKGIEKSETGKVCANGSDLNGATCSDPIDIVYGRPDATADGLVRESVNSKLDTWHEDNCYDSNTVPQAGDLIVFDPYYSNNGMYIPYPLRATNAYPPIYGFNTRDQYLSSHIGYVYKVDNNKRIVYTIEGNSSNMVKAKEYSWDFCGKEASDKQRINGYYRPNYK